MRVHDTKLQYEIENQSVKLQYILGADYSAKQNVRNENDH